LSTRKPAISSALHALLLDEGYGLNQLCPFLL
jgi:hypothetical protein